MSIFSDLRGAVLDAVTAQQRTGALPADLPLDRVTVEPPRDPQHGDAATNAAMVLAKPASVKPRDLAQRLVDDLADHPILIASEIAGPGFINFRLRDRVWQQQINTILAAGERFGARDLGQGRKISVEYCSANPTGPLHVGHGRGTVFGDALANLLAFTGFAVTREYYLNDGGAQIETLARSAYLRYREALGHKIDAIPEGLYPGDYLIAVGRNLVARDGDRWVEADEHMWLPHFKREASAAMLDLIRTDLAALGVVFDHFISEAALIHGNAVAETFDRLHEDDLIYRGTLPPPKGAKDEDWEPREQELFRSTAFGDDVDRPMKRSNGDWTYFASDCACHYDKLKRGHKLMVNVFGADHAGYVKRLTAAVKALSGGEAALDVRLCQLVNLSKNGEPVKMSKRAGTIVTLRDVIDEVGADVVRFIMLTRRNEQALDFDLAKVVEQSKDNPVFYVQYAHARICSVFRRAEEAGVTVPSGAVDVAILARLSDPAEFDLLRELANYPRVVESAALSYEPHRLAFYLHDLAARFHSLWHKGNEDTGLRFLLDHDAELSRARLAMLAATRTVLRSGLGLLGVTPLDEMH